MSIYSILLRVPIKRSVIVLSVIMVVIETLIFQNIFCQKNISQTANHEQLTRIANFNVSNFIKSTRVNFTIHTFESTTFKGVYSNHYDTSASSRRRGDYTYYYK